MKHIENIFLFPDFDFSKEIFCPKCKTLIKKQKDLLWLSSFRECRHCSYERLFLLKVKELHKP